MDISIIRNIINHNVHQLPVALSDNIQLHAFSTPKAQCLNNCLLAIKNIAR